MIDRFYNAFSSKGAHLLEHLTRFTCHRYVLTYDAGCLSACLPACPPGWLAGWLAGWLLAGDRLTTSGVSSASRLTAQRDWKQRAACNASAFRPVVFPEMREISEGSIKSDDKDSRNTVFHVLNNDHNYIYNSLKCSYLILHLIK